MTGISLNIYAQDKIEIEMFQANWQQTENYCLCETHKILGLFVNKMKQEIAVYCSLSLCLSVF